MKKILFTLVGLFISLSLYAQKVVKSDLIPSRSAISSTTNLVEIKSFKINNELVVVSEENKGKEKGYWVKTFDENLKIKRTFKYEIKEDEYRYIYSLEVINGNLCFIEQVVNKKEKSINYIAKTLNLKSFSISEKTILSYNDPKSKSIKKFLKGKIWGWNYTEFKVSKNKRFYTFLSTYKSKNENYKLMHVFDENLELLYTKKLIGVNEEYVYSDMFINESNGAVVVVNMPKYWKSNTILLEKYDKNKAYGKFFKFKQSILDKESFKIVTNKDDFFLVAIYSNLRDQKNKGVALVKLSYGLNKIQEKYIPFNNKQLFGDENKFIDKGEAKRLKLRDVLVDNDGNIYVATEFKFIQYSNSMYNPVLKDIIIVKIDKNSNMLWNSFIEKNKKNQITYGERYNSYKPFIINNQFYITVNSDIASFYVHHFGANKRNLLLLSFKDDGLFDTNELGFRDENDLNFSSSQLRCLGSLVVFYGISKEGYQLLSAKF